MFKASPATKEHRAFKVLLALKETAGHKVRRESPGTKVLRGTSGLRGIKDIKVVRVFRELRELG